MRTILGLSKTSTSIGWVLVDGRDVAAEPLDYDAFDITDASTAAPAATARRVRAIATASGYTVDSVHVTSSGNVSSLRDALTDCGFDDVVSVPLTEATRSWARDTGYADAMEKTAICMLGQDSAALSVIETRSGAIRSSTTTVTGDLAIFTDWLNFAMGADGSYPEVLYLTGSRPKIDDVADHLDKALSVPVLATHRAQIALARGAASWNGERTHFRRRRTRRARRTCEGADRGGSRRGRIRFHAVVCGQLDSCANEYGCADRCTACRTTDSRDHRRSERRHTRRADGFSATRCGTSTRARRSHGDHTRCRCTRGHPGRHTRAARGDAPCGTPSRPAACSAPAGCTDGTRARSRNSAGRSRCRRAEPVVRLAAVT